MPKAPALVHNGLGIRLRGDQTQYAPGDTITGHVFLKALANSPESSVRIFAYGRTESTFVLQSENVPKSYKSQWNLFNSANHAQLLLEGPLHIAEASDEASWPFSITLPSHIDPKCVEDRLESRSFLSLDATDSLPSTFEMDAWPSKEAEGRSEQIDYFIEYGLQAELELSQDGQVNTIEARLPFTLANPNPEDPNDGGSEWQTSGDSFAIMSFRLLPGMETAKLSWSQRMKTKHNFFSTSIPRLNFDMQLEVPQYIRIDGDAPVPFKIGFTPDWEFTSEILREVPLQVKLTQLTLQILTTTELYAEGTEKGSYESRWKVDKTDLLVWDTIEVLGKDIIIPCSEESGAVDVGRLINMRVGAHGLIGSDPSRDQGTALKHGFRTHNIRYTHKISWTMKGVVADKEIDANGVESIRLVPRDAEIVESDPLLESDDEETPAK